MRGVNHPHAWFPERLREALPAIAAAGANAVRVVMATGGRWSATSPEEVREILRLCRAHRLVAILEVHDCTGFGEDPLARPLREAVDWWLQPSVLEAMAGHEAYAMLNVANEPFGNGVAPEVWMTEHVDAVRRLREGGYRHAIMVDAPEWGQDGSRSMRSRAGEVLAADPDRNVVFSVHMYQLYATEDAVCSYLDAFFGEYALVVGEFAADHGDLGDVDEHAILRLTHENGLGCLGWSWTGNAPHVRSLDIVADWGGELTEWGATLVDGPDGLRATAKTARVFAAV